MLARTMHSSHTVFVGLSGGVDSSVAALRLKRAGYNVVGVFIKVWQPDFIRCDWEHERLDAMRVAATLDIPFLTFDAEAVYKQAVVDDMIKAYSAGHTPNPDVLCNQQVKFGAFLDFARSHGARYVATGHYAQIMHCTPQCELHRGADKEKDQSYFLWTLTRAQREHILFPVGNSTKKQIRREAALAKLPTAKKRDSQGICFLGDIDMHSFLQHFVDTHAGNVLDSNGNTIGTHDGALLYTIGQRHGFDIDATSKNTRPHYIVDKDLPANTLTVSDVPPQLAQGSVSLRDVNFMVPIPEDMNCEAQFRYRQKPFPVQVARMPDARTVVRVKADVSTPPAGQSCVLYSDTQCLGGGIIEHVHAGNKS